MGLATAAGLAAIGLHAPVALAQNPALSEASRIANLSAPPAVGVRQFPAAALRGTMQMQTPPDLVINGKPERLSPGHRIRSASNMVVMSGQITGLSLQVNYLRNASGEIHEVWILSRREIQDDRESQREGGGILRNFSFGSDADKPVRDDGKTPFDKLPKYKSQLP